MNKLGKTTRTITNAIAPTLVIIVLFEIILRVTGVAPTGRFDFLKPAERGLYPPNETILNDWGPIRYVVRTNALGLRGTGIARAGQGDAKRIVTIGDSITDGFFVDNDGTFQHFLQQLLDIKTDNRYEVINAARGGGSIDMEIAVLRDIVIPLRPEVAVLTFVTNDISDLRGKTRRDITEGRVAFQELNASWLKRTGFWFYTETALGETLFRLYWRLFVPGDGASGSEPRTGGERRYVIAGGGNFAKNVDTFNRMFAKTDGLVLTETLSEEAQALFDLYLYGLDAFVRVCRSADIAPVFVYFPSYPEIYDPSTPPTPRDILAERCAALGVPFLDLTDAFRRQGAERVLHLAPVDYHPNPAGNEVFARTLVAFLAANALLD